MVPHEIVDANAFLANHILRKPKQDLDGTSLLAIQQYSAVEFRDEAFKVAHHYRLPEISILHSPFWHYFKDFTYNPEHLGRRRIKFRFIRQCLFAIRKIAAHRDRCSLLEIGATIGENYRILKYLVDREPYSMTLEYVGIDKDMNAVAFSRELFGNDPNFQILCADATTLNQFPDQAFDLVISNTVNNRLDINEFENPLLEASRVSRFASVFHLMVNTASGDKLDRLRSAAISDEGYHIPSFDHILAIFAKRAPLYVYRPSLEWLWSEKWDRSVDDQRYLSSSLSLAAIQYEMLVVSPYRVFPELPARMVSHLQ